MRVLQIPNYQYPHIGGIEQVSRDISDALAEETDIEQKIICFNENAKDKDYVCHRRETVHDFINGVEVIRCGCFTKIASQSLSLTYPNELRKIFNKFLPDVVIFHYPNPFVASFLLLMLPSNIKLVLYWHLDITKQKLLGKMFHWQTEALCKRANVIVATSPNYIRGSRYLKKYKNKCLSIPNCIRTERFLESSATSEKVHRIRKEYPGKTICYAVGRHVPYKGMEQLIDASKYLDDSFVVLIGGKGELTDSLKKKARNDSKIVFLGRVEEEDMVAYYKASDIYCFPSITKNEAFGISLAEAMYFGKPAVTFTIEGSGVNYVNLNDVSGIEVPNKNVKMYAEAIKKLQVDHELYARLSNGALERCKNNFLYCKFKEKIQYLITKELFL